MKGIIFYYSGSGSTRLACRFIAATVKTIDFDLCDICRQPTPDLGPYDMLGFATFTSHGRRATGCRPS